MKSKFKLNSAWRHLSPDVKVRKLLFYLTFNCELGSYYRYCRSRNLKIESAKNIRSFLLLCDYDYNWICNFMLTVSDHEELYEIAKTPWLDV